MPSPHLERRRLTQIEREVDRFAGEAQLWPPDGRLLVGVSGGPDSTALLLVLRALASKRELQLMAGYFDHGLRGETAAEEELHAVTDLAERCGVGMVAGSGDVRALASAQKLTIEEAARRARYAFLAATAGERGISTVAVGHTADDQAETILMHILRGSGLTGIAGMQPRSRWPSPGHEGLALVRPLLRLSRSETEAYCRAAGILPLDDASNRSKAFLRNRVRAELLPQLREYNPRVGEALARLGDAARADLAVLESLASEAIADAGPGEVAVDRARLRAFPAGLRRHAVRLAVLRLLGDTQGFSDRHLQALQTAAVAPSSGAWLALPRGVEARVGRQALLLRPAGRTGSTLLPDEGVTISVPGIARLGGLLVAAGPAGLEGATAEVEVDADALGTRVCVRRWRPGDRISPAGMKGTKKLQDLFVDAHVPREERGLVPIFESARGVVWVAGLRLAEWARPREGSPTITLSIRREA